MITMISDVTVRTLLDEIERLQHVHASHVDTINSLGMENRKGVELIKELTHHANVSETTIATLGTELEHARKQFRTLKAKRSK